MKDTSDERVPTPEKKTVFTIVGYRRWYKPSVHLHAFFRISNRYKDNILIREDNKKHLSIKILNNCVY